jgi:hypothetical protein
LVRNKLSVGVCKAPAMPVRKATIKNAVEVTSKGLGEAAAGLMCIFSVLLFKEDAEFTPLLRK